MKKTIMGILPAALRGRYDESGKVKQRLELRPDGNTNTITTIEKDNVIIIKIRKEQKDEQ